jgi:transcription antitermination protein NusB
VSDQRPPTRSRPDAGVRPASGTRSKARKRALDILFESELRGTDPMATLRERVADADPPVRDYTKTLVEGVVTHQAAIDARIRAVLATGWTLPRLPRVDRCALRLAVLEIDHLAVPEAVAISEAIGLVTELSTEESPAFVNGVLGAVVDGKPAQAG